MLSMQSAHTLLTLAILLVFKQVIATVQDANATSVEEQGETILNNQRTRKKDQLQSDQQIDDHQPVSHIIMWAMKMTDAVLESTIRSCNETEAKYTGMHKLLLPGSTTPMFVYCEMESYGGGWLVIQQREHGRIGFYRSWTQYRNGFGTVGAEFWAGLNMLHQLTSQGLYELLVELKDSSGIQKYAHYSEFEIGSEEEKFSLKKLGSHTGTAADSLRYHLGRKFSTFDSDNDGASPNCAREYHGAWWYGHCFESNLNGRIDSMCWDSSCSFKSKDTRMMIRKKYEESSTPSDILDEEQTTDATESSTEASTYSVGSSTWI